MGRTIRKNDRWKKDKRDQHFQKSKKFKEFKHSEFVLPKSNFPLVENGPIEIDDIDTFNS